MTSRFFVPEAHRGVIHAAPEEPSATIAAPPRRRSRELLLSVLVVCLLHAPIAGAQTYVSESGATVDFDEAREQHRRVLFEAPAHVGRAVVEELVALMLASTWYWLSRDLNSTDWDLAPTVENFGLRFTDLSVVRFDTNRFFVNQGHLLAGALSYGIPRANNFGVWASLFTGVMVSAVWEWIFEYREYVSLNDLITSPWGGQPLGEALFKWGELYNREPESLNLAGKALTFLFAQPRAAHNWMADDEPEMPADAGPTISHDFRAHFGATAMGRSAKALEEVAGAFHLQTELIDLPGYHRPGEFSTWYRDGNFTELEIEAVVGDRPIGKRFVSDARAELAGWYGQSIDDSEHGWAFMAGLGRGAWVEIGDQGGEHDSFGMIDAIGPVAKLDLFLGPARLRLRAAVYGSFGSVHSLSYEANADQFAPDTLRSELEEQDYYFGWGINTTPGAKLTLGATELTTELQYGTFGALAGPDRRHHNDVPVRVRLRDRRTVWDTALSYQFMKGADVRFRYLHRWRRSRLDEFEDVHTIGEVGLAVGHRF